MYVSIVYNIQKNTCEKSREFSAKFSNAYTRGVLVVYEMSFVLYYHLEVFVFSLSD